ncbi:class I SAM-dependent methyltransferase [Clostridium estertheticum]|uniref:class I SAM-dependent methyltransferase n=1 Tax=Clostridium estertheticum TaxID=238834 RepID=UPI001CF449C2|nr:class I SAM-dependent methyltransferase [Clostridium estertheticum]MCB2340758.1 class I SAM-dependent methyltransferase [Clostridium estertheticum]
MNNLKKLYNENLNIMDYFRKKHNINSNSIDAILVSYDLQAGSYRKNYYNGILDGLHKNGNEISMKSKKFKEEYGKLIADVFNEFKYSSVLEVGVGESTTLCDVSKNLNNKQTDIKGIDISFSRIGYGNTFIKEQGINNVSLGVADMFKLPFKDNAFDIVYTSHCIEPNTHRAKEAINELYRITNKCLVLIEPSYDLGNEETRKHMIENSYCIDLINVINDMKLNIKEHKLFELGTYNNQAAITIIEKKFDSESNSNWCCPICKKELIENEGNYFCEDCYLIFPVIKKIPCLTVDAGILGSKYLEF